MIKQICILTKSYKHGGYCVAGIDINTKQWVRIVNSNNPENDEIKKDQMLLNGHSIECFDIIEYDFIKNIPNSCQTENWLLNNAYNPKFIKAITLEQLVNFVKIEKDDLFIFNDSNLLNIDEISEIHRSLYIFHVSNLQIDATTYESNGKIKFRYKCSFDYNGKSYTNISLTDPVYRDLSQDGQNLKESLIVASLPCIPYSDNLYYKFVAKIIPIDEDILFYITNSNEEITNVQRNNINSPFVKFDLAIKTQQTPGKVLFENYEQLKANITNGVSFYSTFEYTLDNFQVALKHHHELKYAKNILEKAKRELIKSYNEPLETFEKRINELIDLIKIPFKKVDTFIKQNEKNSKKYTIYIFAKDIAISNGLEEHMDSIFRSPAFFDPKWLNASCSKSTWKSEVTIKIKNAARDINKILSVSNDNISVILANYYQTLSMQKVEEFLNSLKSASIITGKSNIIDKSQKENDNIALSNNNKEIDKGSKNIDNPKLTNYEVLNCVANSINPYTGEVIIGIDDCLKSRLKEIASAFNDTNFEDIDNYKVQTKISQSTKNRDDNFPKAWERWTKQEDLSLIEEFKNGLTIGEIAKLHNRKHGGIRARLKKHSLIK